MAKYVEPAASRFTREVVNGVEQIRVPTRRNWFVMLFLMFWVTFWTFGGIMAATEFVRTGELFLGVWLCGWLAGELFALAVIADQVAGFEIIRAVGRDLELSGGAGPFRRTKSYRGDHIRNLRPNGTSSLFEMFRMPVPSFLKQRWGAVKFDYGADTIYFGGSATEAEGQMIVDWLTPKLPRSAGEAA